MVMNEILTYKHPPLKILYKNWQGVTRIREVIPQTIGDEPTEWHPNEHYILYAICNESKTIKGFAFSGILAIGDEEIRRYLFNQKKIEELEAKIKILENRPLGD